MRNSLILFFLIATAWGNLLADDTIAIGDIKQGQGKTWFVGAYQDPVTRRVYAVHAAFPGIYGANINRILISRVTDAAAFNKWTSNESGVYDGGIITDYYKNVPCARVAVVGGILRIESLQDVLIKLKEWCATVHRTQLKKVGKTVNPLSAGNDDRWYFLVDGEGSCHFQWTAVADTLAPQHFDEDDIAALEACLPLVSKAFKEVIQPRYQEAVAAKNAQQDKLNQLK